MTRKARPPVIERESGWGRFMQASPRRQLDALIQAEQCWVVSDGAGHFWNHRRGWVDSRAKATHFTAAQKRIFSLPIGSPAGTRWERNQLI